MSHPESQHGFYVLFILFLVYFGGEEKQDHAHQFDVVLTACHHNQNGVSTRSTLRPAILTSQQSSQNVLSNLYEKSVLVLRRGDWRAADRTHLCAFDRATMCEILNVFF